MMWRGPACRRYSRAVPVTALLLAVSAPAAALQGAPVSVYRIAPAVDAPVIVAAGLAILLPTVFASHLVHPRCPCDPGEVNALDRHVIGNHSDFMATASDVTEAIAIIAPLLLDAADVGLGRVFLEDATVYAEALAVGQAITTITKYSVRRPRPRVYAGDPAEIRTTDGYLSFSSGHTSVVTTAMTVTAVTLQKRHGQRVWPWIMAATLGVVVAAQRVAAGQHFYTDVAVGFATGAAAGAAVPLLHARF
jgi:membrane-associated phospholipid phosphatase